MRRAAMLAFVGLTVSIVFLGQGLTGASEPNASAPGSVQKDTPFTAVIRSCESAPDPEVGHKEATIEEKRRAPGAADFGFPYYTAPDETDATTEITYTLNTVGLWTFAFSCKHTWSTGSGYVWGPEYVTINVTAPPGLTAQEQADCNKKFPKKKGGTEKQKKTRKEKIKKCLEAERLD